MDNYKLNENVKKGKELLRGFGGKALQLGSGLLATAQEVKNKVPPFFFSVCIRIAPARFRQKALF